MKQDVDANRKDVKDLTLRVEQLEREKADLEAKLAKSSDMSNYVTRDEMKLLEMRMNDAIAAEGKRVESSIKDDMKAAIASTTPAPVAEKPAAMSKPAATRAGRSSSKTSAPLQVSDAEKQSYMKEGIKYTVQPGDTISLIARKNHSSVRAIMATNTISNPSKLYVGMAIFVPTL
jgi:LysM repeat protein